MTNKVKVTQQFINRGVRGSSYSCPVAMAMAQWDDRDWEVTRTEAINSDGKRIRLSFEVLQFICDFDHGRPVFPFEFEVTP